DVLYSKIRPYLNKVVIADRDGVCSTEILPLSGIPYLNNSYLLYWLKSPVFISYATQTSYGVNMPRLGTNDGKKAPFLLAPLFEQDEIVSRLDELFNKINSLKYRINGIPNIIKQFRESILSDAVNGVLTENWREKNINSLDRTCLENVGIIMGGNTPSKANPMYWRKGNIPWVSPKDMKVTKISSSIDKVTEKALSDGQVKLIPENSILMVTRSGILIHSFPIALTTVKVTINQDIKAFIPDKDKILPHFASILLRGHAKDILSSCSKSGTTVPSVETQKLLKYRFNLPSLNEQKEIVKQVDKFFIFSDQIEAKLNIIQKRVENFTPFILKKAFQGKLTSEWRAKNPSLITGKNSAKNLLEQIKLKHEERIKENKHKRASTKRKINTRKKKVIIPIVEALKKLDQAISANELLIQSGYPQDASTEQIEDFFLDIRQQLDDEKISCKRKGDEDYFMLINQANKQ
ncbi:MAG: hypothetical protein HAW67_06760, partial [Endozoicomonadaceae bacterium]|nr:hypothetical protein [Endozoicomonadaceae bacterium]